MTIMYEIYWNPINYKYYVLKMLFHGNAVLVSYKVSCIDSLRLYQYSEACPLVL